MARGFQGAVLRGLGARDHAVTVVEKTTIAPHFVRIRMSSPTLFSEVTPEPTAWLRFWFPDPDGGTTEFQRAYTIAWADPAAAEFAVDVVLHEPAGPASTWLARAEPGMTISAMSMGSSKFAMADEPPAGFLLIGDAAAIPAINSILSVLPIDVAVELYLETHGAEDELIPLVHHPRCRLHWVPRIDDTSLAAAIEDRDWSDWYAWVAGEAGSLKLLRTRLRDGFGFPKTEMTAQAYWTHARAMGSRRDATESAAAQGAEETAEGAGTESARVAAPFGDGWSAAAAGRIESAASRGRWRSQAGRGLLAPIRSELIVAGVMQALITLIGLAPFVVLVEIASLLLAGADEAALWLPGMVFLGLLGVGTVLGAALTLWLHVVDLRFSGSIRERLLGKLARIPLGWFTQRGSGAIKKLIQDDTLALHYLVTHAVPDAVAAVVAPVAVLAYLFVVDWRMALVLLVPIVVYVATTAVMAMQSGPKISQASRWAERMNGEAAAYLDGQPVIRMFGGPTASSFRRHLDDHLAFLEGWQRPLTGKKSFMDLVTRPTTFLWLICVVGTLGVVTGTVAPATLLPFLVLGTTFGGQLLRLAYGLGGLRDGRQALGRIAVTLDEAELSTVEGGDVPAPAVDGTVTFDGVAFGYRPGVRVIDDVGFTMVPGTVTALVGPSGSGKSTLAALLARFHDVEGGAIRIDGRDIRGMTLDELYTRVGFVFQQPQLTADTVADNIALARPDADRDDVTTAAMDAQIHQRIQRLPDGYDTVLGASSGLSGGETQRMTIARALLADTPILILDEATAFADPESEYLVQQALGRLARNRTVLVIAHRLHTIVDADQIIVLDHGRVAERGSHRELLEAGGRYERLWAAQASGTPSPTEEVSR